MNDNKSLISTLAITEVLNQYFAALDQKKFNSETMNQIFSEDAKIVRPDDSVTVGSHAIGESHAKNMSHFRATQHLASNFIITLENDTEARIRLNLVAMHMWAEGEGDPNAGPNDNYFLAGGVITGRVTLLAGGWRIVELANDVIWRRGVGFQQILNKLKNK